MYPIITISGPAGSGKSTIAESLAKQLSAERIYVGGIRRQLARDMGMNLAELNEYALTHPETDINVDKNAATQARKLAEKNIVIVEGRTQFYFIPESIKLYIKVDPQEGAKRIWQDIQIEINKNKRNEGKFNSLTEVEKYQKVRQSNDLARYQKYYQLDHTDEKHYNFILDTTHISAQEATDKALEYLNTKLK
ncbi:MAG: CMP/dCMP kinase [Patescibacteria group bacterium]|nr:CMP/dCMP kinase [Patescibacteria group bacterium]MDQ5970558.1 CMP/dCMP kinase [Patescibacteria group bacterium]